MTKAFQKRPAGKALDERQLHFSYGANMSKSTLQRRGILPRKDQPAVLESGIRLRFQHRGGYATLIMDNAGADGMEGEASNVHGVLYEISATELQQLCRAEGGYYLADVTVHPYSTSSDEDDEGIRQATATVASAFVTYPLKLLREPVDPTARYLGLLRGGARDAGLDPTYQEWLHQMEPAPKTGRGLGRKYYDSPQKYIDWTGGATLLLAAFTGAAALLQQP